jgi:acylphosphatase
MKAVHLLISGHVQGVGFRDWLVQEATQRGLAGWVRNKGREYVEAVLSGEDDAVDACVHLCWQGPALARVSHVGITETAAPEASFFTRRSSVAQDP